MKILPLNSSTATVRSLVLASMLAVVLSGCASTAPEPTARMAVAEAAVQRANNTTTNENAPSELLIATTKLASARQAVINKDFERAEQLADQAQLDARVAELHAQSEISRKAALETQDAARVLREEIDRKTVR